VPLDGGLLGPAATPVGARFSGAGDGASCFGCFFPPASKLPTTICTGEAAVRSPATQPPRTRPSGPASETLSPPVRLRWPPFSDRRNDPDRDSISKRPSYVTVPPEVADCRSVTFDMAPFAERMQTARVPCCENDMIFADTSWKANKVQASYSSEPLCLPAPATVDSRLPAIWLQKI